MNATLWMLVGQSLVVSSAGVPMHFGEAQVSGAGFELPIEGAAQAVKHAERHVLGDRIILFVPGAAASAPTRSFGEGPVSQLKVTQAELGVAITLVTRESATAVAGRLELVGGDTPAIRIGEPGGATRTADGERAAATTSRRPLASVAEAPAVTATSDTDATQPRFRKSPLAAVATGPATSPVPTLAMLGTLLIAAAGVAVWLKRKRVKAEPGTSIQVLAVRAIGPKQKLMMVETAGERFLLAASDKDVHLLSSLAAEAVPAALPGATFEESLEEASAEVPTSQDVAGLLRLRGQRPTLHEVAA